MLSPICTIPDASDYGYTDVTDVELAKAAARIRGYTRQDITSGTSTILLEGTGPWLLPQRPVTSVTSVVNEDGDTLDSANYRLRGQRLIIHHDMPMRFQHDLTVTYSHGFTTIPDQLIELCAQIATRLAATPDDLIAGAQQMQTGAESMSYGAWATNAVAELMPSEKAVLDRLFPSRPRTTVLL